MWKLFNLVLGGDGIEEFLDLRSKEVIIKLGGCCVCMYNCVGVR